MPAPVPGKLLFPLLPCHVPLVGFFLFAMICTVAVVRFFVGYLAFATEKFLPVA